MPKEPLFLQQICGFAATIRKAAKALLVLNLLVSAFPLLRL